MLGVSWMLMACCVGLFAFVVWSLERRVEAAERAIELKGVTKMERIKFDEGDLLIVTMDNETMNYKDRRDLASNVLVEWAGIDPHRIVVIPNTWGVSVINNGPVHYAVDKCSFPQVEV